MQLKKRFLAQATHELKTPIAVIKGYSEILHDNMYKDEVERESYYDKIYKEADGLSHLIIDVLDYTKIETGNYELILSKINTKEFIVNMISQYDDFIKTHNLTTKIEINISKEMEKEIDVVRFEQVYKNLISNAVEHAKSLITIKVDQIDSKIKVSIYNDGNQISKEDLPNIFNSFYKTKEKQSGYGLGLAIVKEIVQLHHGEWRVTNQQVGVEFIIVI